ncbi:MAG: type II toxin-antitoxin system HicA family toxin [Rhodothermales bacterium]
MAGDGVRPGRVRGLYALALPHRQPGAIGAELSEGRGSRMRVYLGGVRAVFHRPHPEPETDKGALKSVRRFLVEAGVEPGRQ